MESNKNIREAMENGYKFQGAWINNYCSEEEKIEFKERRKELKKEGHKILTLSDKDGKGLYIKGGNQ